ncbi:MAG: ABC transporter ATP-binding protein [Methanophagales archaeon]|nr:ABC transporter ATP-binding protein [Methanophagales archaeon]MCW3138482.1 ABC transporter ATP-binding protein [Methanophagales archaeon]MCW3139106.1 ABC transporter ATP-binding protein [Methanophagales archaeon]MCW7069082.1 ABC transporter ATP-binding protein [Methanophagales archaeon]
MIRAEHLSKVYRMGKIEVPALRDVSLEIEEGEFLAIVGPSGSGKSTLLNMLGCLDKPTSGAVFIGGVNTASLSENELAEIRRKKIGFIFQQFNLIHSLTALENVALPMFFAGVKSDARIKRAAELLAKVGLRERMHHKPSELSGGQQQRVAIARALSNNPAVIIGDEPTGNVDSETGDAIMGILEGLNRNEGRTIIVVTHDTEIAAHAPRVIRMKDGRLLEE